MDSPTFDGAAPGLEIYDTVTAFVVDAADDDLLAPSRCRGWVVGDVVFHLTLDAVRALTACATPCPGPADVDARTYWSGFQPSAGSREHARWVRVAAGALSAAGLRALWADTGPPARRAVDRLDPDGFVRTQGQVVAPADLAATLVVEATIHYLDMTVAFADAPPPPAESLGVVRASLDALLGSPVRADWSDAEYALKGSGRVALDDEDRRRLGDQAARFPLLG